MDGILNINKPKGLSSFAVVGRMQRIAGMRHVGHAGTLDPLATGVLLVCCGKATKIASHLAELEKEYLATVKMGVTTDTFDAEGRILEERKVDVTAVDIAAVLPSFVGEIEQVPPMYSALKHHGRRLYQLARAGEDVYRQPRKIHVADIHLVAWRDNLLTLRVICSKGTYVRSLAHDMGSRLGCGAHLADLERTRVGSFHVDESLNLEWIRDHGDMSILRDHLLSISDALAHLPAVRIGGDGRRRISHGMRVMWEDVIEPECWDHGEDFVRILDEGKSCIAIGRIGRLSDLSSSHLCPLRVFI